MKLVRSPLQEQRIIELSMEPGPISTYLLWILRARRNLCALRIGSAICFAIRWGLHKRLL